MRKMDLKQKVDELIEIFENTCKDYCASHKERALININLSSNICFSYHIDTGAMMFADNVWYLNNKDLYQAPGIDSQGVHDKLKRLICLNVVSIQQIEAMIFGIT